MKTYPQMNRYDVMWMLVLFDLPVTSKKERKAASGFRNFLLDNGFFMAQYSIYLKVLSGKDASEKYYNLIEKNLPENGKIDIVSITDKQYENIKSYVGKRNIKRKNPSKQLLMF